MTMTNERKQRLLCVISDDNGQYYYNGPLDGIWGPASQSAADRFLKDFCGTDVTDINVGNKSDKDSNVPAKTGTFWDDSEFFDREEFRCQCKGKYCNGFPSEPDRTLVELVDDLRAEAGKPGHASSGLRCSVWNSQQGGVSNSRHLYGKALDFYIEGLSGSQLLAKAQADSRTRYAYIIDGQWVHVDVQ